MAYQEQHIKINLIPRHIPNVVAPARMGTQVTFMLPITSLLQAEFSHRGKEQGPLGNKLHGFTYDCLSWSLD